MRRMACAVVVVAEAELRAARDAFEVRVAAESTTDISNRIYNNASDGGFK